MARRTRDWGFSVRQTADSGYIIAGTTWVSGTSDVLLLKTDANGNKEWRRTFGGRDVDWGYSVQQTAGRGYIVAGTTWRPGARYPDVYLIKTDPNGELLWSKTFGGARGDWGYSVQQTADSGYIIAGKTNSFGAGDDDVFLVKTDMNGKKLWARTFGGRGDDWGHAVQQTADRGYIIAGTTNSSGAGDDDLFLIKTDMSGKKLWARTFGGRCRDLGESVRQTAEGGYIVTGTTWRDCSEHPDVYLVKTDARGKEEWSRTFGGAYGDYGHSVRQTIDLGYIVAGYTKPLSGRGNTDVYLVKTDAKGRKCWSRTFGGKWFDAGYSVQQTAGRGYIIVGKTGSLANVDDDDIFLIKTDHNGNELWSRRFD